MEKSHANTLTAIAHFRITGVADARSMVAVTLVLVYPAMSG
jgi:hypothetical protein